MVFHTDSERSLHPGRKRKFLSSKWNGISAANQDLSLEVHISGREDHQNGEQCYVETLKKISLSRYLCKKLFLKKHAFMSQSDVCILARSRKIIFNIRFDEMDR